MTRILAAVGAAGALLWTAPERVYPIRAVEQADVELAEGFWRDRVAVSIHLLDGRQFDARIKNFDRFAVIVEVNGTDQLVFKHAIATISTPRAVPNYFASHHP